MLLRLFQCFFTLSKQRIHFEGNTYRPVTFVITGWQMDDLPEFSQIQDIFIVQSVCFLRVNAFFTKGIGKSIFTSQ